MTAANARTSAGPVLERLSSLSPGRLAGLRSAVGRPDRGAVGGPVPRLRPDGRAAASATQEQQWFLQRLTAGTAAYLVPFALHLRGPLDVEALGAALEAVSDRHQVLRSVLELRDGRLEQVVRPPAGDRPHHRLTVESVADWRARATELAREPFDLARGPLVRTRLLRIGTEEHVLVWVAHHAVADGASVHVLLGDLATHYRRLTGAGTAEREAADRPLLQYADVAQWQHERLTPERTAALTGFWREHLGNAPAAGLPAARPRPATPSFHGAALPLSVPPEVAGPLTELAAARGTTPFAVLLAALQVTLSRCGGQADAVIGAASSGRRRPETEELIGPFATPLPLRVDAGGDPPFAVLVDRVGSALLAGLDAAELPFNDLVRELGRAREPGRNPLYDVLFTMDPLAGAPEPMAPGLSVQAVGLPNGTARLDLQLTLGGGRTGMQGRLDYSTELYDEAEAAAFARTFLTALRHLVADPERPIGDVALLDPAGQTAVLERTAVEPVRAPGVLERFAAQVAVDPARPAVHHGDRSWSYGELDDLAARVAARVGAASASTVAVVLDRSIHLVAALLGVLRAGAVYVPLDPHAPADRRAQQIRAVDADLVLHEEEVTAAFRTPAHGPDRMPGSGDRAYVMFTSGSTGEPKGVPVGHGALAAFLASMARLGLVGPGDRVTAVTSPTFDISFDELLLPLTVGAQIEVVDRATARDGAALRRLVESAGVTVLHGTPTTYRLLIAGGWTGGPVRRALCGGEALPTRLAGELTARVPETWNLFGPTEATVWSLAHRVTAADAAGASVPIGVPLHGDCAVVLDRHGRPVPPGVLGELHLGGAGLAEGYLHRPALTAERFVAGPDGRRLYRTGDIARQAPDGRFFCHGRIDHQIKLRGFRIEPGEVETALEAVPGVRQAVVMVRELSETDRRLVGFIRTDPELPEVPEATLRDALARRLPDQMIPAHLVRLEAFPTTTAGKVDRAALATVPLTPGPEPDDDRPAEAAATRTEEWLAAHWATLLEAGAVGVTDRFFSIGGHSLLAVRLLTDVHDVFGVEIPLETFFAEPTVRALAAAVDAGVAPADGAAETDDDLLARVEGLSDDEVAALLAEEVR
jgi:amino acid adenylation domain-containing protein